MAAPAGGGGPGSDSPVWQPLLAHEALATDAVVVSRLLRSSRALGLAAAAAARGRLVFHGPVFVRPPQGALPEYSCWRHLERMQRFIRRHGALLAELDAPPYGVPALASALQAAAAAAQGGGGLQLRALSAALCPGLLEALAPAAAPHLTRLQFTCDQLHAATYAPTAAKLAALTGLRALNVQTPGRLSYNRAAFMQALPLTALQALTCLHIDCHVGSSLDWLNGGANLPATLVEFEVAALYVSDTDHDGNGSALDGLRLGHLTNLTRLALGKGYGGLDGGRVTLPPRLVELQVGDCESAEVLVRLPQLRRLALTSSQRGAGELLDVVGRLPGVTRLKLGYDSLAAALRAAPAWGRVTALRALEVCEIKRFSMLPSELFQHIAAAAAQLTSLRLPLRDSVADPPQAAALLQRLTSLAELKLQHEVFAGQDPLASVPAALPALRALEWGATNETGDLQCPTALARATQLTRLDLQPCRGVRPDAALFACSTLTRLRHLTLHFVYDADKRAIDEVCSILHARLPHLTRLMVEA